MTTKPRFGFVQEYVSDMEAAKRFYVDVLGLEIERDSPHWVQLKDQAGHNYAIANDASLGSGRDPELYWLVDDADAAFRELSHLAEISLPLTLMPFGNVFGIKDPDGQSQFLVEFAQNRPSQKVT